MRWKWFLLVICVFLAMPHCVQASNPFLAEKNGTAAEEEEPQISSGFSHKRLFSSQFQRIVEMQRYLYKRLSEGMRTIRDGESAKAWGILALAVFAYGILHALGPGHGKIFIVSYFLSRRAPLVKGFVFAFTTAFLHAGISTVAVLFIYRFVEQGLMRSVNNAQQYMMIFSYAIIIMVGALLLFSALRKNKKEKSDGYYSGRHFFSMSLSIALTPCPATILVMIFSLSHGMIMPGLFAVMFLALGMGLSLGCVALLTISASSQSLNLLGRYTGAAKYFARILSVGGPVLIMVFGIILLGAQLI